MASNTVSDSEDWIQAVTAFIQKSGSHRLDLQRKEVEVGTLHSVLKVLPSSQITKLNLEGTDLSNGMTELTEIVTKTKIMDLNISSCNLSNQDLLTFMKVLEKTRVIDLDVSKNYFDFEDGETQELASYLRKSQLTYLNLGTVSFQGSGGLPFVQVLTDTVISHLNLSKATLSKVALVTLFSNLPKTALTSLDVSENQISDDIMEALQLGLKSSNLKILNLRNNNITDAGIITLLSGLVFSQLIELDLSYNDFHVISNILEHLKNTPIKTLYLEGNQVEDREMLFTPELWDNSALQNIDLGECNLSEEVSLNLVRTLKKSKIVKLGLSANNLQQSSITEFANSVKNTKITEVDFSENDLQGEDFDILGNCLKGPQIKSIDISNNFKHPVGDEALAQFITKTKESALESLKMNYNELLSYGAQTIASSLANTNFTYFDLSSNWIEDGVAAIAEILKLTQITILDVSNNKIEDEGAEVLARCLAHTQIVSLNINTNAITDRGAKALAKEIGVENSNLLELKIEENEIENDGLEALAAGIKSTYITTLDVKNNPGDRMLHIDTALWKNRKAAQKLISVFKRITKRDSDGSIGFADNVTSKNVDSFVDDCLWISQTIKLHKNAFNVLIRDESITFSRSQMTTFMNDEFPTEFTKFVGRKVEADVEQHVNLLRKAEKAGLGKITALLLLNRPNYIIDHDRNILHPYVYRLLDKYRLPLFNETLEPFRRRELMDYFCKNSNLEGASLVCRILDPNYRPKKDYNRYPKKGGSKKSEDPTTS